MKGHSTHLRMDDSLLTLRSASTLPPDAIRALDEDGFVVLPGPVPAERFAPLVMAYDAAVASAPATDVRVGRTSTRVNDFVSRGSAFDGLYSYPPLLEACCHIIGRPFKLSSLHARTLHAGVPADTLHVDVSWESEAWPLAAFILMVDAFRPENGATRFVPGSHPGRSRNSARSSATFSRCRRDGIELTGRKSVSLVPVVDLHVVR